MSLHRWSLPSRAFPREKSKDVDPDHHARFPTIHIGDSISRRRANISSAFANLFEKDENRLSTEETSGTRLTASNWRPFSRIENLTSSTRLKLAKRKDGSGSIGKTTLQMSGPVSQVNSEQVVSLREALEERDECEPLDDHTRIKSSEGKSSDDDSSPSSLTRVRSASSSYPSEGIRSPPNHCHSPQLNTWTKDFIAEITHFGTYPSGKSQRKTSSSTNDTSGLSSRAGKCLMEELAAAGGTSDTDTRTASRDHTLKPPFSDVASTTYPQDRPAKAPKSMYYGNFIHTAEQEIQETSQRNVLSGLDGQGSSTSAIHGSYPELGPSHTSSSDDEFPFRPSPTSSAGLLRGSMDTGKKRSTRRILWRRQGGPYHTMPASVARDNSWRGRTPPASSPLEKPPQSGFHFRESDRSSVTLVERIYKFKLRKWIKKVCIRTKVRFDHAMNIEAAPKTLRRRKPKSYRSRKAKKYIDARKATAHSTGSHWKTFEVTKRTKRSSKEKDGIAQRFMNSLKPKHSIHFPVQEKARAGKRRVQSCPH
ncbi:uncharacterized protein F4812DRAFT_418726 [Daldinia caldariorum]|uniref:uncharacterized protein n=1 Tax=Daldinia caldariorum TaxID=326644 RepID=UPI002008B281|nr:uncharacterized protein F4812DRAFT_418726 [Daldinia caldariorum]KAI1470709.1 hypothetical protein F4812DRAFT_418726 [Daldinia caldariorum]